MAEICSYTLLFTNNLKAGIEQFVKLIEHPEIVNTDLITVSIFFKIILKIFSHNIFCVLYEHFFFFFTYVFILNDKIPLKTLYDFNYKWYYYYNFLN